MSNLEKDDETRFQDKAKSLGVLSLKLNMRGSRDFPDQTVLCPDGHCFFIEFKLPLEEPRSGQAWYHRLLRRLGFTVYIAHSTEEAMKFLKQELDK